jgi:hypothetical protein
MNGQKRRKVNVVPKATHGKPRLTETTFLKGGDSVYTLAPPLHASKYSFSHRK